MGGEVAAGLLAGYFSQLSFELGEVRRELREVRRELSGTQEKLAASRERTAVLEERCAASVREKHIRNASIVIGTAITGIGIDALRGGSDVSGYVLIGLGVVLLIVGWLAPSREAVS